MVCADDPEYVFRMRMKIIIAQVLLQSDHDHHSHRHCQSKPENINECDQPVSSKYPESDPDITFEHIERIDGSLDNKYCANAVKASGSIDLLTLPPAGVRFYYNRCSFALHHFTLKNFCYPDTNISMLINRHDHGCKAFTFSTEQPADPGIEPVGQFC